MRGDATVLSREAEVDSLRRFLGGEAAIGTFVLVGEPGIGKTTLWEQGIAAAQQLGYTVLSARASEAEADLSFAALGDLVDGIDPELLAELPGPQLRAIGIALRRVDAAGAPPDPLAIGAGFLGALRLLSERGPVLVAADDLQWMDRSSIDALLFAARRPAAGEVRFLLARRTGRPTDLERTLQATGVETVEVKGLSSGAVGRLLSERLGLTAPRRVQRQLFETSQGNPLFALELGRLLVEAGELEFGADLPFPHVIEDAFGARVRELPEAARRALLAVALSASLTRGELEAVTDVATVEDAESDGLLHVDRARVRPSHPMLAAAVRHASTRRERRELHRDLAAAVADRVQQALHIASATHAPDETVAATVASAAALATERGAVHEAQLLADHALRLTALGAPQRPDRLLALTQSHLAAGEFPRAEQLLEQHMEELPSGRQRALGHLLRAEATEYPGEALQLEMALAECGDDVEIRAIALSRRSFGLTAGHVSRIDEAEAAAVEAVEAARSVGGWVEEQALAALAWSRVMRGRPVDSVPFVVAPQEPRFYHRSIERPAAVRLGFRGEVGAARAAFHGFLDVTKASGDARSEFGLFVQLCEVEVRAGDAAAAAFHLQEFDGWSREVGMSRTAARLGALVAATAGEASEARRLAEPIVDPAGWTYAAPTWDRIEATRALGVAALVEHDADRAVELLGSVWEHCRREHVDDPGAFPVAGDLVEALVSAGDIDRAREVTAHLATVSGEQDHPWGLATARRCEAVLALQESYVDEAVAAMEAAAASYGALGLRCEQARTLLMLGRVLRRHKKSGAARRALEEAASVFDQGGCAGWADEARSELARISGRRPASEDKLTPSERRVAGLAASGMSNKEIAAYLFVSVYTVEEHLSNAYAKLGIRSRGQLAQLAEELAET